MDLTAMDWVRAALLNAQAEHLTIDDLVQVAKHAKTAESFDTAVNTLVRLTNG